MASGAVNPIEYPEQWDRVVVGGVTSPGKAEVGEFKRAHEWDVKKGKGTLGATTTFVGRPPAKGTVTFELWTIQHFIDWETFRKALLYDPTKQNVQAVEIYHPSLADIGIHSVVTENVGNAIKAGKGKWTIAVEFLEYFPAPKKSAVSTPSGSTTTTSGSTPGTQPDPIADAQQKEIAALLAEAGKP